VGFVALSVITPMYSILQQIHWAPTGPRSRQAPARTFGTGRAGPRRARCSVAWGEYQPAGTNSLFTD